MAKVKKTKFYYVSVYGTLRKNQGNHRLIEHAKFIQEALTVDKYPLVVEGLPYLFNHPGVGHQIECEIYKVDADTLARLDRLEGHPTFYYRQEINFAPKDLSGFNSDSKAWIYFINRKYDPSKHTKLVSGYGHSTKIDRA